MKFLENTKKGFKRTVFCNKCRSEKTIQLRNNNIDYMIDPTFANIPCFFFHSDLVEICLQDILLLGITCH